MQCQKNYTQTECSTTVQKFKQTSRNWTLLAHWQWRH